MRTVSVDISIRPSRSLSPAELDEIWALTERYVETPRAHYERKLLELPEVSLWRACGGALVGLAGLDAYPVTWQGRARTVIFTSSVVTDERFRGRNLVLRTGLQVLLREKLRRPWAAAYWFFDTFSYRVISCWRAICANSGRGAETASAAVALPEGVRCRPTPNNIAPAAAHQRKNTAQCERCTTPRCRLE